MSKNIRFLRKERKLSQQQLADALEIKRSNIAAYETKGVEPRLFLINEMAVFFNVPLARLITADLSRGDGEEAMEVSSPGKTLSLEDVHFELNGRSASLANHAHRVNQMLEGFRVFYEYKRNSATEMATESDIDNFLVFVNHMYAYNKGITSLLKSNQESAVSVKSASLPRVSSESGSAATSS